MKLRIKGDSSRLRVSRSEVARLLAGDCLEETIYFAPEASAKFTYALQQDRLVGTPTVQYTENRVAIQIPAEQANAWGVTDQVGIVEDIALGDFGSLALLIEKDFACLAMTPKPADRSAPSSTIGSKRGTTASLSNACRRSMRPTHIAIILVSRRAFGQSPKKSASVPMLLDLE
jgi:hypothetical protein